MAAPIPISRTPSLSNQSSPQVMKQQRERQTAQRLYEEQERRNQELRRTEEEARRAEQDKAYADVSKAADTVNETGDRLETAADRYNDLINRYNSAKSDTERTQLRNEIESARIEYNELSGKYAAESSAYNTALNYAQASGAVSGGETITYNRETISSPFEGTEAELTTRQKERQDILVRQKAIDELNDIAGNVNTKSASLTKSGSEYNALIDEFNTAKTSAEQERIKGLIENKAEEYNLLSVEFESAATLYNAAVSTAKSRGYIDESAANEIIYKRQTVNPLFEDAPQVEQKQETILKGNIPKTWAELVQSGTIKVISTGQGATAGGTLITAEEMKTNTTVKQDSLRTVVSNAAAGGVALGVGLMSIGEGVKDFIGNAGMILSNESDKALANAAVGALSFVTLGKAARAGISNFFENGIEGNPLTTEYTLPGNITWQPQTTAAQDREREQARQEESFNRRIEFFNETSNYFAGVSKNIESTRPDDSNLAKGISEFMKFNKGEAEADEAFVMRGAISITEDGISFNRPSVYLTGLAALTAGAAAGLAALGAGGAAAAVPEGAAVAGSNLIRGGNTATATVNSNPAITGAGGAAIEAGKQNAALLISSSEVRGDSNVFVQSEIGNASLFNQPEVTTRKASVFAPELFNLSNTSTMSELGTGNKVLNNSELSVNKITVDSGISYSTGSTLIDGYPVRQDKLTQLKRIGVNNDSVDRYDYGYGNENSLLSRDVMKIVRRVGIGNKNSSGFDNSDYFTNKNEDETRNRNRYEYGYRYSPEFRFENVKKVRLPDIDFELKTEGEKKKRGKKKKGSAVLKEHYVPTSKEFIGNLNLSGKRKNKSNDLFKSKNRQKGKKGGSLL